MDSAFQAPRISRGAIMIAVAALLLRLAFVAARDRPLFSDEIDYDRLGWTLATTGHYSDEGLPTAYRPIGYPALIAGAYAAAGRRPVTVQIVQAALGAASSLLLWFIAGGGSAGLWAAGIWAIYPPSIMYADLLLPETAFTTILLVGALLASRGAFHSRRLSLLLGVCVGLAALLKATALLLLAALPLAAIVERVRPSRFGWLALGAFLALAPWLGRNWIVIGYPTPATSVGANLLIGNNPNATGGYSESVPPTMIPRDPTEGGRDAREIASALRYVRAEPLRALRNGFAKIAHFFGSEGGMIVWTFHPSPGDPSTHLREKYRSLPVWLHLAVSGPYALAMLIGSLGFFTYPQGSTRAYFLAALGATLATHFVFYGGGRYHFPLMPFFVLFTAGWWTRRRAGTPAPGQTSYLAVAAVWAGLIGTWIAEIVLVSRP